MPRHRSVRIPRRHSRRRSSRQEAAFLVILLGIGVIWFLAHFWFLFVAGAVIAGYIYHLRAPVRAARREAALRLVNLQQLSGYAFEQACAAMLQAQGWRVRVTQASGDYGADLVGTAPDGQQWVVQAKQWQQAVGPRAVQEVVAAKAHYHASHALVITTSRFTSAAATLARENNVVLWDADTLRHFEQERARTIANPPHVRRPPTALERWLRRVR